MGAFEIVTIVVVGIAVAGVLAYLIYKKVKGESAGCDCGSCGACPHCGACKPAAHKKSTAKTARAQIKKRKFIPFGLLTEPDLPPYVIHMSFRPKRTK